MKRKRLKGGIGCGFTPKHPATPQQKATSHRQASKKPRKPMDRRIRLWKEDPRCCWCGRETILIVRPPSVKASHRGLPFQPNEATLEHIRPKSSSLRRYPHAGNGSRLRLACWECNNKRGGHLGPPADLDYWTPQHTKEPKGRE